MGAVGPAQHSVADRGLVAYATALVSWQRAEKSDAELAMMRKAGQLIAHMHATLRVGFLSVRSKHEQVSKVQAAGINVSDGGASALPPHAKKRL